MTPGPLPTPPSRAECAEAAVDVERRARTDKFTATIRGQPAMTRTRRPARRSSHPAGGATRETVKEVLVVSTPVYSSKSRYMMCLDQSVRRPHDRFHAATRPGPYR